MRLPNWTPFWTGHRFGLDTVLEAWRNRPLGLGEMPYLVLDARYEKVRQNGIVQGAAVLVAIGIGLDGKRQIIGVSVALSEQEAHWRQFLKSLVARGLSGVRLIVSDDHSGLKAARQAVFGFDSLAAVPVPPAAERSVVCSQAGDEGAGCGGSSSHLHGNGSAGGGNIAQG